MISLRRRGACPTLKTVANWVGTPTATTPSEKLRVSTRTRTDASTVQTSATQHDDLRFCQHPGPPFVFLESGFRVKPPSSTNTYGVSPKHRPATTEHATSIPIRQPPVNTRQPGGRRLCRGQAGRRCGQLVRRVRAMPASLSTAAGTPSSRNAIYEIPLRSA